MVASYSTSLVSLAGAQPAAAVNQTHALTRPSNLLKGKGKFLIFSPKITLAQETLSNQPKCENTQKLHC